MKQARILLSGGGTGGHLYPALALADAFKKQYPTTTFLFVGAQGKPEMEQVPAAGYPIIGLPIQGIQRKQILPNLRLPFRLIASLRQASHILKQFQPTLVIGTGGYASGPVVYLAAKRHLPTLIQEQNAQPGWTNRFLGRYVHKICVAYPGMAPYFPPNKIVLTGNPIREELIRAVPSRTQALAYFGLKPQAPCLLVLGGSLGSATINQSILQGLPQLLAAGLQIIWATGIAHFSTIQAQLPEHPLVKPLPFIQSMAMAYAAADLVITRAGALTIAELCIAQKPAIFVPSPYVAADHQTQNVAPLLAQGAALLVPEAQAHQQLVPTTLKLLDNPLQQQTLAQRIQQWATPQATRRIVAEIAHLAGIH